MLRFMTTTQGGPAVRILSARGHRYQSRTSISLEAIMASHSRIREIPMPSLRVGRRGQITIPSALRRELQLEEGDHVIVQVRAGELILRPIGRSIFALRGSVPVDG